ncbi:MAG: hypothetical protein ACOVQX_04285 [Legionella sp.]
MVTRVLSKQGLLILENRNYALLQAAILALLPFTAWLSVAVVMLVTLRKGAQEGAVVLLAAMMSQLAVELVSMATTTALINTLLTFLPSFLVAYTLRLTISWQAVSIVFLGQILTIFLIIHIVSPDFIIQQYLSIRDALKEMHPETAFFKLVDHQVAGKEELLANYMLGIQGVALVITSLLPLMLARALQSSLFYPGGLRSELLQFRSNWLGLTLLLISFCSACKENLIAVNLLPAMLFYFLLTGLSLSCSVLKNKKKFYSCLLLLTPLIIMPLVAVPIYVIIGCLDSLFNFRMYLTLDVDKKI